MTRLNSATPPSAPVQTKPATAPAEPAKATAVPVTAAQVPAPLPADQVQLQKSPAAAVPAQPQKIMPGMSLAEFDQLFAGNRLNPNDFHKVLVARPDIRARLEALPLGSETAHLLEKAASAPLKETEIRQLQTFLTQSVGARIAYPGQPTGVDGIYGSRTHGALESWLRQQVNQPAPAPLAPPAPPSTPPAAPASPVPSVPAQAVDARQLNALLPAQRQSLQTVARVLNQLPAEARQRLEASPEGKAFAATLASAAERPLNRTQVQQLQRFLTEQAGVDLSYPGHATGIDGSYGGKTYQGLKQVLLNSLDPKAAPLSPAAPKDGPYPRYVRMLEDQLLDMTMAVGFDEGGVGYSQANLPEELKLTREIESRGFQRNDKRALELLKGAGKEVNAQYSAFYVKENIGTANGKPVHSVIRVLKAGNGSQGAQTRKAALEGMNQSDVFMYGGHARYGTGPDFDSNFKVTIDWTGVPDAKGKGKVTYADYSEVKDLLGENDMQALKKLRELQKQGKASVEGSNGGNIQIGKTNKHPYEFGSHLMLEALEQGPGVSLKEEINAPGYRLWLFNGCRTHDYQAPLRELARSNPAFNTQNLDMVTTNQTLWWHETADNLLTFLDGVMKYESASRLTQQLQAANPDQGSRGPTHVRNGFDDNPLTQPLKP